VTRGFSLVELMTVIAMVGILSGAAAIFIKPSSHAASAQGYAQEIAAMCDVVRQRAAASRTRQMIEVAADHVAQYQASEPGMTPAVEWELVGTLPVPARVAIASTDPRAHLASGDGVPSAGAGLPLEIEFAPDGTSTAATIFVHDDQDRIRARVAILRATGSAFAYSEW
jgi:prepilin-type N-terminal cleavage/methylation domain-containing protein